MKANPILDEIRAIRDAHAKQFNYDFDAIYEDLRRYQRQLKKHGWKLVKPAQRRAPTRTLVA